MKTESKNNRITAKRKSPKELSICSLYFLLVFQPLNLLIWVERARQGGPRCSHGFPGWSEVAERCLGCGQLDASRDRDEDAELAFRARGMQGSWGAPCRRVRCQAPGGAGASSLSCQGAPGCGNFGNWRCPWSADHKITFGQKIWHIGEKWFDRCGDFQGTITRF